MERGCEGLLMIRVYGCSDDLVECDGAPYPADEIGCFEREVMLQFEDETVIHVGYPKKDKAVWWIKVIKQGNAPQSLTICEDENTEIYSDIFTIESQLTGYGLLRKTKTNQHQLPYNVSQG